MRLRLVARRRSLPESFVAIVIRRHSWCSDSFIVGVVCLPPLVVVVVGAAIVVVRSLSVRRRPSLQHAFPCVPSL